MYKAILEGLKPGPVVFVDDQHIVRYMNEIAIKKFVKLDASELIGKSIFECHQGESVDKIKHYFKEMQAGRLESVNVRKKGQMQGIMQAVKNDAGVVIGYLERHEVILEPPVLLKENSYLMSAKYYDVIMNSKSLRDIEFYKKLIGTGSRVMEFGCGTGRIGLELAMTDNLVHGVDHSAEMLAIYNQKIVDNMQLFTKEIKTFNDDILSFTTDRRFDYVLLPCSVFQVFFSDGQRKRVLNNAKSILKPEGKIVLHVIDPDMSVLEGWSALSILDGEGYVEKENMQVKAYIVGKKHYEKPQIYSYLSRYELYKGDTMTEQFEEPRRLAYQNDKQMRELFEAVELEVEQGMSDWMGTPIQDATRNDLIYVLKSQ